MSVVQNATAAQNNTTAAPATTTTTETTAAPAAATTTTQDPAATQVADPAKPAATTEPAKEPAKPTEPVKPSTPAAPEKYELKTEDGSLLQSADLERIEAYAKARGLTQEQAQAVVDNEGIALKTFADGQKAQHAERIDKWIADTKADKELGGDNFVKNVEMAHRALNHFGSDTLKAELDKSGFGNHPEIVRVFAKIGQAMSDDSFVKAKMDPVQRESTRASRFYDKTTKPKT